MTLKKPVRQHILSLPVDFLNILLIVARTLAFPFVYVLEIPSLIPQPPPPLQSESLLGSLVWDLSQIVISGSFCTLHCIAVLKL